MYVVWQIGFESLSKKGNHLREGPHLCTKIFACGKIVIISPLEIVFVFNFGRLQRLKKYDFLREREDNFAPQVIFLEKKREC